VAALGTPSGGRGRLTQTEQRPMLDWWAWRLRQTSSGFLRAWLGRVALSATSPSSQGSRSIGARCRTMGTSPATPNGMMGRTAGPPKHANLTNLEQALTWHIAQGTYFLEPPWAVKEPNGNTLLGNTIVLCGSAMGTVLVKPTATVALEETRDVQLLTMDCQRPTFTSARRSMGRVCTTPAQMWRVYAIARGAR
jgi:hypothetical protein